MNKDQQQFLLVDSYSGLKIVSAIPRNFYNSSYAVQFVGTKQECKAEGERLNKMAESWNTANKMGV